MTTTYPCRKCRTIEDVDTLCSAGLCRACHRDMDAFEARAAALEAGEDEHPCPDCRGSNLDPTPDCPTCNPPGDATKRIAWRK